MYTSSSIICTMLMYLLILSIFFVFVSTVGIQLLGEVLHVLIATLKGSLAHQLRPGNILR